MSPIENIRTRLFRLNQAEFAAIAGVRQGTVSRWERGILHPSVPQLLSIRIAAAERGIALDDSLFFETRTLSTGETRA